MLKGKASNLAADLSRGWNAIVNEFIAAANSRFGLPKWAKVVAQFIPTAPITNALTSLGNQFVTNVSTALAALHNPKIETVESALARGIQLLTSALTFSCAVGTGHAVSADP